MYNSHFTMTNICSWHNARFSIRSLNLTVFTWRAGSVFIQELLITAEYYHTYLSICRWSLVLWAWQALSGWTYNLWPGITRSGWNKVSITHTETILNIELWWLLFILITIWNIKWSMWDTIRCWVLLLCGLLLVWIWVPFILRGWRLE